MKKYTIASFYKFIPLCDYEEMKDPILSAMKDNTGTFVSINAKVNSDQYISNASLVADFRHNGKTVSYNPAYLKGQTLKGKWNSIDFGVNVPAGITAKDSVLVYFYLPVSDEEMMIDDFCVSLKQKKAIIQGRNK